MTYFSSSVMLACMNSYLKDSENKLLGKHALTRRVLSQLDEADLTTHEIRSNLVKRVIDFTDFANVRNEHKTTKDLISKIGSPLFQVGSLRSSLPAMR